MTTERDATQAEPRSSYAITAPHGGVIEIPHAMDPVSDPYSALHGDTAHAEYYAREGYVVFRDLLPRDLCDEARRAFAAEVKPYDGYLYRQATANPEKHVLTSAGHVLNSLLNVQDLDPARFPMFRGLALALLTHPALQRATRALLGEPGKIVQTMYFEGNPATWAHQDTYYLDSASLGRMAAAWVAVEDIHPGAGRFYVYPGSHRIDMARNGGDFDIAFNHDRYKQLVVDVIKQHGLECRAPALRKGDVLFWAARTIHGSLETRAVERSRASFTTHFIPASTPFMQFQKREKPLALVRVNGIDVHHPKYLGSVRNRAILKVETTFPDAFQAVKRLAVKAVTR